MTFEQMKIFLEAAHFGSFTHAAERLGLTQSAVSVSIKKLEEKYDVSLFDRSGRRLMLTDAGQVLLNEAERILRDVDLTIRRIESRRPTGQSSLVACTANAYDFWMPELLAHELGHERVFGRRFFNISHEVYQRHGRRRNAQGDTVEFTL